MGIDTMVKPYPAQLKPFLRVLATTQDGKQQLIRSGTVDEWECRWITTQVPWTKDMDWWVKYGTDRAWYQDEEG